MMKRSFDIVARTSQSINRIFNLVVVSSFFLQMGLARIANPR
jgi:hypothetical protein